MRKFAIYNCLIVTLLFVSCNIKEDENATQKSENILQDTLINNIDSEYLAEKLIPIRKYVNEVDSIKEWSLVIKKDIYFSTEGGVATFYNWNGKLKRIEAIDYGETYQKQSKYYINNDTLVFVYEKVVKYNRPIYHDSTAMKELGDNEVFDFDKSLEIETESYFKNGLLIWSLDNKDCGAPHDVQYRTKEQERIFKEFNELKKVYKSIKN